MNSFFTTCEREARKTVGISRYEGELDRLIAVKIVIMFIVCIVVIYDNSCVCSVICCISDAGGINFLMCSFVRLLVSLYQVVLILQYSIRIDNWNVLFRAPCTLLQQVKTFHLLLDIITYLSYLPWPGFSHSAPQICLWHMAGTIWICFDWLTRGYHPSYPVFIGAEQCQHTLDAKHVC